MPVPQNRGQHGFLKLTQCGAIVTCEKTCQRSALDFSRHTAEYFQHRFVAAGDVAFKIDG